MIDPFVRDAPRPHDGGIGQELERVACITEALPRRADRQRIRSGRNVGRGPTAPAHDEFQFFDGSTVGLLELFEFFDGSTVGSLELFEFFDGSTVPVHREFQVFDGSTVTHCRVDGG
jgi:hypothetical protein